MAGAKAKTIYDVHPGVAMVQKWIAELKEKTGRSLEEWKEFVKKEGPKDEKAQREWLTIQHKLGTNSAWWIAARWRERNRRRTRRRNIWRQRLNMWRSNMQERKRHYGRFMTNS